MEQLESMPSAHRRIIRLIYDGYDTKEVAELLVGRSVGGGCLTLPMTTTAPAAARAVSSRRVGGVVLDRAAAALVARREADVARDLFRAEFNDGKKSSNLIFSSYYYLVYFYTTYLYI